LKEERSLINAIAGRLGRIVERVDAGEALQSAHDGLELRVQERTAELGRTNLMLQSEIVERKRAYEAEQSARQIAETLRAASQALTQTLDMDTVFSTLLDHLGRLVPFDSANIALLGDEAFLAVKAVRGYDSAIEAGLILGQSYNIEKNPQIQELLSSGKSILISDIRQFTGWKTYLELDQVGNWLGVPLVIEGKVIGLCGLDKCESGFFTQEHLYSAETLIGQATVAIQNAWLFEQVRAGRERLQSLSRRLVDAQESERRYVSRELHDEAGQALASLKVGLHLLERDANRPEAVIAGVAELKHMADEILENLHRLAMDLRPASLDYLGLMAALQQYLEAFSDKHDLTVQFETTGFNERLPLDVETALYRIVQEALTNVIRHAQATRADVILERRQDKLIMIIEDNGVGIDLPAVMDSDRLGIVGMRERTEMLGGEFTVERTAGAGTTVHVEVPYGNSRTHRG
jgi:nitrate/nitrite-specific signal transduction histidine kinase